jgi:hypothetical protein
MSADNRESIDSQNDERRHAPKDRPERDPDPDTLEGPGDRQEAKGEADARNKTTRRGER